uniref:Sec-independent protein translocase component tatA/E n=1 Tax=Helicotheca tamesis TaxID=374047 RepID=UPI0020295239|nr:Sec-independent protein translocase component tatA/E [Helicotheca tamesis]QYB23024.1 Sec-independent protein translocase component tatA/E [Helicotheca tamesis]
MANINFSKILVLIILFFLLFGDFSVLKKNITKLFKQYNNILKKKKFRKKGSWTLALWFWKPLLYQLNYFPYIV